MSKVILEGHIIVLSQDLDAVIQALPEHIKMTQAELGNITFQVSQSIHHPLRFDVYEEFVDSSAFEFHQRRVKQSKWGKITTNVIRHYTLYQ
ncbi:antibiotic biosynthesis monooxygenase [Vibrio sp. UCD-FRSSP16_10]|uniref:putative quinol monooxygenase n=1 Tax=unclassified Vibrio TaxID=2614977 RepID=UPI0008004328|nr:MULTISPECIES: antibiotic biosynthesis monooxygenase [unclassified Vibrio]OBT15547.1 antibiotic biosynthesis monooxygenase [Vibrio sp. UCD-FRSSP16_30]OBT20620.1 antibiotic biosynthesis monooxygenase [Vibrio sp. UCD-FRSSP16_10]